MTDEITINKLIKENERLKQAIKKQEFGLVWMNIPEAFEDDFENKIPILKEIPSFSIKNDDGKPTHILIEGDNYHSLTCLNYTHREKIDLIYIDPPYNTGSDGFKYKDKRIIDKFPDGTEVPKDNPFRHSYWLSFMKKRLELARNLLRPSGVIFISINEEELAQLKLLCDQIFGPLNYLTMFTIKVRHEQRILKGDKDFHEVVEYLLLYRKSKNHKTTKIVKDNTSIEEYVYQIEELTKKPEKLKLCSKTVEFFKPSEFRITKKEPSIDLLKKINIRGTLKEGNSSGRFYMAYLDSLKNKSGYLVKVPDMGDDKLGFRYFLLPKNSKKLNGDYFQGVPLNRKDTKEVPYPNFFDFEKEFNGVGYEGGVEFRNGKKPIKFIQKIFEIGGLLNKKNGIVLDFFAGSGSTAHALLDLNENRICQHQVIICTNNEVDDKTRSILEEKGLKPGDEDFEKEGICRNQCLSRMRNIMLGTDVIEKLGNSLKYYKTSFVGRNNVMNATDSDRIELAHNAGELLSIAENTLELIKQNKYYQLFGGPEKFTAVYFREELDKFDEFLHLVESLKKKTVVYIFSWGDQEFVDDFGHLANVTVKTIPKPILEIYENIYNLSA